MIDPTSTRAAVEELLFEEARLLDQRRFADWLKLLTPDFRLWVPIGDGDDPDRAVSVIYDDRQRLEERIWRLDSDLAYGQQPPSTTCRIVGNVTVGADGDGTLDVRSTLLLAEIRYERQSLYPAHCEHRLLVRGEEVKIAFKKIELLARDTPLGNLSFLL